MSRFRLNRGRIVLGSVAASKAAKAAALCICPVVGTAVVTTQVPAVRKAVHIATSPKEAKRPKRSRLALKRPTVEKAQALPVCADPIPVVLGTQPLKVSMAKPEPTTVSPDEASDTPQRVASLISTRGPVYAFQPMATVPEPGTWAQMLGGFAVVGETIRFSRRPRALADGTRQA